MIQSPGKKSNLQHNVVSLLYSIQGMAESYLAQAEEGRFAGPEERLRRAEEMLKKNSVQAEMAPAITQPIRHPF